MSHLANLVLDNKRLALLRPEPSLTNKHTVLKLLVARITSLP